MKYIDLLTDTQTYPFHHYGSRISLKEFTLYKAVYLNNENPYCSEIGNKTSSNCTIIHTFS